MAAENFPAAHARAAAYNRQLDERLRHTGIVDAALFNAFASVQADPNASSVGWLQAKLQVLQTRLTAGGALQLHEPSSNDPLVVTKREPFMAWTDRHFSIARVRD